MTYVGIDCGYSGAIAVLRQGREPEVFDMPVVFHNGRQRDYDAYEISSFVRQWHAEDPLAGVCLEKVTRPGSLRECVGIWRGSLWSSGLIRHTHLVRPQEWKKFFGLTADKQSSLLLAREMFPSLADKLKRAKDHNRAEALLLAEYARRTY